MRVLITGGSGLLGINWAKEILPDHKVAMMEHHTPISLLGVEKYGVDKISEIRILEIFKKFKPNLVINTIALTSVEKCEQDLALARYINIEIAKTIAEACHRNSVKMVHISTDHLYDQDGSMFSEDDPISPINNYAITKAEAEEVVLGICSNALVIRTNFYGPGLSYRDSFASKIIKELTNKLTVKLFNDVFYTPIIIKLLVNYVNQLVKANADGIFNVVSSERISKYQFGIMLANVFKFEDDLVESISIKDRSDLVRRPADMSLSNKKISRHLDIKIPSIFEQIKLLKRQI